MAVVNNCVENKCINLNDYLSKKINIAQKPAQINYLKNNKFLIDLINDIELFDRIAQDIDTFNELYGNMIEETINYEFGGYNKKLKLFVRNRLFGN